MSELTVPDAARRLGISAAYLRRLIAAGDLPARRIGPATRGGQWLLDAADVQQLAQQRAHDPPRLGRPALDETKGTNHDHP